MIFFWLKRLRDFFFDPGGCVIFVLPERWHFFFGPRGCMIFFWPKRLHDFFWPERFRNLVFDIDWLRDFLWP